MVMVKRRPGRAIHLWTIIGRLRRLMVICWAMLVAVALVAIGSLEMQSGDVRGLALVQNQALTFLVALLALLAMLVLGRLAARSISRPLTELRNAMVRASEGDLAARAREDQGTIETRSLAVSFNELTAQNLELQQTQARALAANRVTAEIGRAIRGASDIQQALDVVCAELGERLGADRVIANAFRVDNLVQLGGQWQRPDLQPLVDLSELPNMAEVAGELWRANRCLVTDDLPAAAGAQSPIPQSDSVFCQQAGARASVMVPIGLGERVIGMISVLMVGGPRTWEITDSEVVTVVAEFVARAIIGAEHKANQLEYVQRVERLDNLKTDFLSTVSHELRTPLTSIMGYLELLKDADAGEELTAQQGRMLDIIGRNTTRLRGLIEDVMMLNRIEGGVTKDGFEEVSIRALLHRVVDELRPLALGGGIELDLDGGPAEATAMGDQASLERAVVNILSNAIKFSHRGGVVTISGVLDEGAHRVLIICQDRGVGIPEHDRGDLFTRFFRASNATDQSIPGTGLGLSIAKQIVEDHHGGHLRLISTEGEGTTVVIDLPQQELSPTSRHAGNDRQPSDVFGIRA